MKIGEKIVFLRRKKGITQAELADQLHFTRQAVSNWERGITEPDAHTLSVIAAYFGISTDELLGISSERQSYASAIGTDMDHVRYGFDIGNAESVSAAKALRVLLWVYTWLYAAQILFSFPSESGFYVFFGVVIFFCAAAVRIAVFVLFLFAKQSGRAAPRVAFFVCLVTGEIFSFALLSDNVVLALAFGIAALLLLSATAALAPVAFRAKNKRVQRRCYIAIGCCLALSAAAIVAEVFVPENVLSLRPQYLTLIDTFLALCAGAAYILALFVLERALRDRIKGYKYIGAAESGKPVDLSRTEKSQVFQSSVWTNVFLLCFVLPFVSFFSQINTALSADFCVSLFFFPLLFGALFFIGKRGKHLALTVAIGVLWCANLFCSFYLVSFFLVAPDSPVHNLSFAEACPNFLLWSALYAAVLFGFCAKKGIRRPAGIALRCLYLAVAVFSVGAGIYYIAAVDVKYAPSIAFLLMYGFSLLLFLTHFLTQDRMVTQNSFN